MKDAEFLFEQSLYPVAEYAFKHPLTQEVALGSQLKERSASGARGGGARDRATKTLSIWTRRAALLAHHYEEAGETGAAARWHRRAAEWVGLNDIKAALQHWQRVRELARHGGDEPEVDGAHDRGLFPGAHPRLASGGVGDRVGGAVRGRLRRRGARRGPGGPGDAQRHLQRRARPQPGDRPRLCTVRWRGGADRRSHRRRGAALRDACLSVYCARILWTAAGTRSASATKVIELAREDLHLGTDVAGFSPLLTARCIRQRCIGFTRDPATALARASAPAPGRSGQRLPGTGALDVVARSGVEMCPRQLRRHACAGTSRRATGGAPRRRQ